MIIPDANLIIYANHRDSEFHGEAAAWWIDLLDGEDAVGLTWVTISAFLRITTHPKIFKNPFPVSQAADLVRSWLERSIVRVFEPEPGFHDLFLKLVEVPDAGGNLMTDAYLAALAIQLDAELHSTDNDFHRFPGLRWRNPLKP